VRVDGQVRDAAVLVAMGVQADGKRTIRGVSVSLSKQEAHGRQFLPRLLERGLRGVQVIISDAHEGLQAARRAVFGGVPWQRYQFHLQQNAQASVPRQELTAEVAAASRAIFTAPSRADARCVACSNRPARRHDGLQARNLAGNGSPRRRDGGCRSDSPSPAAAHG
jgi:transposase-like protein